MRHGYLACTLMCPLSSCRGTLYSWSPHGRAEDQEGDGGPVRREAHIPPLQGICRRVAPDMPEDDTSLEWSPGSDTLNPLLAVHDT